MFALIEDGICKCINSVGFKNLVKSDNQEVIEHDLPEIGKYWDGRSFVGIEKSTDDVITENQTKAKLVRDTAISSYVGEIMFNGFSYQSSERSKKDITDTLECAALKEITDDCKRPWRLTDNSYRDTSVQELRELLVLVKTDILNHKESVWDAFTEWDSGDKLTEFVIE